MRERSPQPHPRHTTHAHNPTKRQIMFINFTRPVWTLSTLIYMFLLMGLEISPDAHPGKSSVVKQVAHNSAHVPAYMILTFLLVRTFQSYKVRKIVFWAFAISVWYGWLNEILQSFSPGRTCSVSDEVLNILGTTLALLLFKKFGWMERDRRFGL